jgi:superfamily II helicase
VAVINRTGLKAEAYHAGLPLATRNSVHRDFMLDKINVVIATVRHS